MIRQLVTWTSLTTIGENRQLVTDEPVEFEKYPVEDQNYRKITDCFRGIYGIYQCWTGIAPFVGYRTLV